MADETPFTQQLVEKIVRYVDATGRSSYDTMKLMNEYKRKWRKHSRSLGITGHSVNRSMHIPRQDSTDPQVIASLAEEYEARIKSTIELRNRVQCQYLSLARLQLANELGHHSSSLDQLKQLCSQNEAAITSLHFSTKTPHKTPTNFLLKINSACSSMNNNCVLIKALKTRTTKQTPLSLAPIKIPVSFSVDIRQILMEIKRENCQGYSEIKNTKK